MSQDRLHQIKRGFADSASQAEEPPDRGSLRALAEREELVDTAVCGGRFVRACPVLSLAGRAAPADCAATGECGAGVSD